MKNSSSIIQFLTLMIVDAFLCVQADINSRQDKHIEVLSKRIDALSETMKVDHQLELLRGPIANQWGE